MIFYSNESNQLLIFTALYLPYRTLLPNRIVARRYIQSIGCQGVVDNKHKINTHRDVHIHTHISHAYAQTLTSHEVGKFLTTQPRHGLYCQPSKTHFVSFINFYTFGKSRFLFVFQMHHIRRKNILLYKEGRQFQILCHILRFILYSAT